MEGIQFNDNEEVFKQSAPAESQGIVALVQKWGWAKDKRQANYILLGIAAIAIMATAFLLFGGSSKTSVSQLPPDAYSGIPAR